MNNILSNEDNLIRIYFSHFHSNSAFQLGYVKKKIILVGAGRTGEKIAREILNNPSSPFEIIGFMDDDQNKIGNRLHGCKILGKSSDLPNLQIIFDEILLCVPSANSDQIRNILSFCKKTGKKYKTVPTISEVINGEYSLDNIRDVSYVDLLGR